MRRSDAGGGAGEARVLRRTRIRLVAWSAGSTLLVLLALGAVLYVATARFLAADAEAVLRARAASFVLAPAVVTIGDSLVGGPQSGEAPAPQDWTSLTGPLEGTAAQRTDAFASTGVLPLMRVGAAGGTEFMIGSDPAQAGLVMGGPVSGTIAIAVPDTSPVTVTPLDAPGFEMALAGTAVVNETQVQGVPMRILSLPVQADGASMVIQVASDRSTELRTLDGLAIVLVAAGAVAVLMATALGWIYAGRALVPVRDSLRRQREFAADASHELRTPLAVIRGNLDLLRRNGGPGPTGAVTSGEPDPIEEIDAEVGRLTDMVDQLLLLARVDSDALELERTELDLGAEAADALDGLAPLAAAREVSLGLEVEPLRVVGDPARLRQLAAILIDNAVRHAPRGGNVAVTAHASDGSAHLTVTDDGPGIRPEDLPHVFERFWRAADAPTEGSGLGLSIASWIAERHGGSIVVGNAPSGGARFDVRLPLA